MGRRLVSSEEKISRGVDRSPGQGPKGDCHEWRGSISPKGYGQMWEEGRTVNAHRVAFRLAKGYLVRDLQVLHSCDNRRCCNAEHLFQGTHTDNMRDAARKGRLRSQKVTHCPAGHAYAGDNLRATKRGRNCRACIRIRAFRRWKLIQNKGER